MDLRQGKSGFPDRSLLGAGGSGPMAFIATEILTKAPPDLRLLGNLVSGFHRIRLKHALVSRTDICTTNLHVECYHTRKSLFVCLMTIMAVFIASNQFLIMNTLSCDWSEPAGPVWEIAPIFCGIFNLSDPNPQMGQIAHKRGSD